MPLVRTEALIEKGIRHPPVNLDALPRLSMTRQALSAERERKSSMRHPKRYFARLHYGLLFAGRRLAVARRHQTIEQAASHRVCGLRTGAQRQGPWSLPVAGERRTPRPHHKGARWRCFRAAG